MLVRQKTSEDWNFQKIPQHISSDNKTVMRSVFNANLEYFFPTHKSQIDLFFSTKILLSATIKKPLRSSQTHFRENKSTAEVLKIRRSRIIWFQYNFNIYSTEIHKSSRFIKSSIFSSMCSLEDKRNVITFSCCI